MKALLTKQKMINKVILIPEYKIKPNPYQPRKVFDEEKIEQLATSIAQYGLLQPITVLPMEDGNYQLVAGERSVQTLEDAGGSCHFDQHGRGEKQRTGSGGKYPAVRLKLL